MEDLMGRDSCPECGNYQIRITIKGGEQIPTACGECGWTRESIASDL